MYDDIVKLRDTINDEIQHLEQVLDFNASSLLNKATAELLTARIETKKDTSRELNHIIVKHLPNQGLQSQETLISASELSLREKSVDLAIRATSHQMPNTETLIERAKKFLEFLTNTPQQ